MDSISLFFTFLRKLFLSFFFTGIHQCTLRKFLLNLLFKYSIVLLCTFPIGQFRAITIHNMDSRIEELYMCIMRYTYIAKKILRIVQVFQFHFDYSSCEFYISHFFRHLFQYVIIDLHSACTSLPCFKICTTDLSKPHLPYHLIIVTASNCSSNFLSSS